MKIFKGLDGEGLDGQNQSPVSVIGKSRKEASTYSRSVPPRWFRRQQQLEKRIETPETEFLSSNDGGTNYESSGAVSSNWDDYLDILPSSKEVFPSSPPRADPQDRNIYFDFTPSASFELGINSKHESTSHTETPIDANSMPLTSTTRGRKTGQFLSVKPAGKSNSGHRKANKTQQNAPNPHDAFLSKKYDRKRIERYLEIFFPSNRDDNDSHSVDYVPRHPLHQSFEEQSNSMKEGAAGEIWRRRNDASTNASSVHDLPYFHQHVSSQNGNETKKSYNFNYIYRKYENDVGKEQDNDDDDVRSVNNAIAMKNLVSAPRLLCEGTKRIPSVISIQVQTYNDDDDDMNMNDLQSKLKSKSKSKSQFLEEEKASPLLRETSTQPTNNVNGTRTYSTRPDEVSTRYETFKSSLQWIQKEENITKSIEIGHYDDRRPWRKTSTPPYRTYADVRGMRRKSELKMDNIQNTNAYLNFGSFLPSRTYRPKENGVYHRGEYSYTKSSFPDGDLASIEPQHLRLHTAPTAISSVVETTPSISRLKARKRFLELFLSDKDRLTGSIQFQK